MAVTLRLDDDVDVSRGDMLCRPTNRPIVTQDLDATVCWMDERSELRPGRTLAIKHTSQWARAKVTDLGYRLDVNTLHRETDMSLIHI